MNKKRQRAEIGGDNGFEAWGGYMAAKKNKLQGQFQDQASKQRHSNTNTVKSDIFKNVSIFVNGYTVPSSDELKRIMMIHGGNYHHYMSTEHTTHVIASNLPDVKIKKLKSLHVNVVKPEWITACVEAGHQVDFRPYLLYSHQSTTQPSIRLFAGPRQAVASGSKQDCQVGKEAKENEFLEVEKLNLEYSVKDGNHLPPLPSTSKPLTLMNKDETLEHCSSDSSEGDKRKNLSRETCDLLKNYCESEEWQSSGDLFSSQEFQETHEDASMSEVHLHSKSPLNECKPSDIDNIHQSEVDESNSSGKKILEASVQKEVSEDSSGSHDLFTTPELEERQTSKGLGSSMFDFPSGMKKVSSDYEISSSPTLQGLEDDCESKSRLDRRRSSEDLFSSSEVAEVHKTACSPIYKDSLHSKAGPSKNLNSARCASEPNFLSEFYNNSRLHHISTMGAMFKQYVSELRQKASSFPGLTRLKEWKKQNSNFSTDCYREDEDFNFSVDGGNSETHLPEVQSTTDQVIMHIDMDCFFVSVGLRDWPHLKGKPVAVTHSKGNGQQPRNGSDRRFEFNHYREKIEAKCKMKNGEKNLKQIEEKLAWMNGISETDSMAEIASCSYEARKRGVKNGMFMGAALKLCPDLKVIPYDFDGYKEVAFTLYNTVASYTLDIEAVSCDEMFVDCTKLLAETYCTPLEFANFIRQEIKEKTMCPASTGFGPNRLLARLATRKAKPDGVFHLKTSAITEFMKTINVKDLPGVGRALGWKLKEMGILTCGDMQKISLAKLQELGSKTGEALFSQCRGQDNRPLNFNHQRKSVSAEVNYGIRFKNQQEADVFIRQLSLEVQTRLHEVKMKGKCITLKLLVRAKNAPTETAKFMGHGVCDTIARSSTLSSATSDADCIASEVLLLMQKLRIEPSDLRGVGIQMTNLENLNSVSSGGIDRFLVKKKSVETGELSDLTTKSNCKGQPNAKSEQKNSTNQFVEKSKNESKTAPFKKNQFSSGGTVGIDQYMVARKKSSRSDNVTKLPPPSEIDLDVLEALPENIRHEIMEAYSTSSNNHVEREKAQPDTSATASDINLEISYSQVDPTFLQALPFEMRRELEEDFNRKKIKKVLDSKDQKKIAKKYSLQQSVANCTSEKTPACSRGHSILWGLVQSKDVKNMIRQWVSEERQPQACDIHILKHYLVDLVEGKKIEDLSSIFRLFHRCVEHSNMVWKEAYHEILTSVQTVMQNVYHSSLLVEDFF